MEPTATNPTRNPPRRPYARPILERRGALGAVTAAPGSALADFQPPS
jgi:hypothetical protein